MDMKRIIISAAAVVMLLVTGGMAWAAPADGPQPTVYYGRGYGSGDVVQMMGLADYTEVLITNLSDSTTIWSGTLHKWSRQGVSVGSKYFRIESGNPVFAYTGYDCCMFGGTFYYPSTNYGRRAGKEFVFFVPVQNDNNRLSVLGYEPASVTLYNMSGAPISTNNFNTAPWRWELPVANQTPYQLVSTGTVSLVSLAPNGYDAVPSRLGDDTGTEFLFMTHSWGGGGFTVFAYEDSTVTVTNVATGVTLPGWDGRLITAGSYADKTGAGLNTWRLTSTGRVGVWAGDFEGGSGAAYLGDDLSLHQGFEGREFWFHTQLGGATIFASRNGTNVTWRNVSSGVDTSLTLNRDQYYNLAANMVVHLTADKPVLMESIGGTAPNDYGSILRPVPPGVAAGFRVTPSSVSMDAGSSVDLTVVALDDLGNLKWNYSGTVALESTDPGAQLPAPYTFGAGDNGSHLFPGAIVYKAGQQVVTGRDSAPEPDLVGTATVTVLPCGIVRQVVMDPADPSRLFAGLDKGGIWKSSDSGATWQEATTHPANRQIKGFVKKSAANAVFYAATYGSGIFRSVDSANSWAVCANTGLGSLNATSLAIDSSGKLYAGTEAGIFASTDCDTWSATDVTLPASSVMPPVAISIDPITESKVYTGLDGAGIYRSTNSGGTWTEASTQPTNKRVKALVINPGDRTTLYAATYGGGVFKSVNVSGDPANNGRDWSVCKDSLNVENNGLTNLNIVSLGIDANGKLYAGTEAGVFVSDNECVSWTAMNNGLPN